MDLPVSLVARTRRLPSAAAAVGTVVALLMVAAAPAAARSQARQPHFRPHYVKLVRGHVATLWVKSGRARSCRLSEHGPHGRSLHHRYRMSSPRTGFTVKARRSTARGTWRFKLACRTASGRRLHTARTRLRVRGTHGHRSLTGVESRRWPDASAPQRRALTGAGYGGSTRVNPFDLGQCTWWAFNQRPDVYNESVHAGHAPAWGWNGGRWWKYAQRYGHFPVGTAPQVGALLSYGAGTNRDPGHVAYVTQVYDANHFVTTEMNTDGKNIPRYRVFVRYYYRGAPGRQASSYRYRRALPPDAHFVYRKTPAATLPTAPPAGIQGGTAPIQGGTTPIQGSTTPIQGSTTPIQGSTTPVQGTTPPPDDGGGGTGGDAGTPPPPTTYPETTGGAANTWSNYTNAGGTHGPTIPAFATVQIACRRTGFRVADGNTWWYQIASSPWNGRFYVSADAFYNNGQRSGSLHGTPFVDSRVRLC